MNKNTGIKLLLLGLMTMLFAGCVTHRIDWNSRIGHYTYDQAVVEFGPPDKSARLTDGRLVVDWITRYNNNGTVFVSPGYYPGSIGYVQTAGPTTFTDILRLTFDKNNVLTAWVKK